METKTRDIILDVLPPGELGDDENFVENGLLDSLDALTFIFALDKAAGRKLLDDHEVTYEIFTLNTLAKLMETK